jgi:hypothetical protein
MRIFKGLLGMSLAFVLVLSIHKVASIVQAHFDHIDNIESSNQVLTESNSVLQDNNDVLQAAIIESEEGKGDLIDEIKRLQGANEEHERKQLQQQRQFDKQQQENFQIMAAMAEEMHKAGLHNIRLPADVVRMQREQAKAINTRARSYSEAESGSAEEQTE